MADEAEDNVIELFNKIGKLYALSGRKTPMEYRRTGGSSSSAKKFIESQITISDLNRGSWFFMAAKKAQDRGSHNEGDGGRRQ